MVPARPDDGYIEPLFETNWHGDFGDVLQRFDDRINSLYRFHEILRGELPRLLRERRESLDSMQIDGAMDPTGWFWSAEDIREDAIFWEDQYQTEDQNLFPEFLAANFVTQLIVLLENFLSEVADELASLEGEEVTLSGRKGSYIQQYLGALREKFRADISLDKNTRKTLDAIGAVRNRFIHKLRRDLPQDIQRHIESIFESGSADAVSRDPRFVEHSFKTICTVAEEVQAAIIDYCKMRDERTT